MFDYLEVLGFCDLGYYYYYYGDAAYIIQLMNLHKTEIKEAILENNIKKRDAPLEKRVKEGRKRVLIKQKGREEKRKGVRKGNKKKRISLCVMYCYKERRNGPVCDGEMEIFCCSVHVTMGDLVHVHCYISGRI